MFFLTEQDRQDFEQEYALQKVKYKFKKRSQAYCDFIRKNYGDNRHLSDFQRKEFNKKYSYGIDKQCTPVYAPRIEFMPFNVDGAIKNITKFERALIILHNYLEFSLKEIAYMFGVTESYVSMRIVRTIKRINGGLNEHT